MRQLKWFDVLAPLGLLAVGASLFAAGRLPGSPNYYALGGLALIVAHVVLRWEAIVGLIGRRQMRHGGNAVALSLIVLGILVFANWIVNRHVNRWDFSKEKLSALSEQSKKVVQGLKEDVQFVYFPNLQSAEGEEQTRAVREQLREYQAHSKHISLEVVDGMRQPQKARSYAITSLPTLIIKRGERQDRVVNTSEQDITNALIRLTRNTTRTVCFVQGEGERRVDDTTERGFSAVKAALDAGSYAVSTVSLFGEAKQLEACSVRRHRSHPAVRAQGWQGLRHARAGLQDHLPEPDGSLEGVERPDSQRRPHAVRAHRPSHGARSGAGVATTDRSGALPEP
jgi:hypothetical protein